MCGDGGGGDRQVRGQLHVGWFVVGAAGVWACGGVGGRGAGSATAAVIVLKDWGSPVVPSADGAPRNVGVKGRQLRSFCGRGVPLGWYGMPAVGVLLLKFTRTWNSILARVAGRGTYIWYTVRGL